MAVAVNRSGAATGDVTSSGAVVATGVVIEAQDRLLVAGDNSEEGTPTNRTVRWRPDGAAGDGSNDQTLTIVSGTAIGSLPRPALRVLENPTPSSPGGGWVILTHTNPSGRKTCLTWATLKGASGYRTPVSSAAGGTAPVAQEPTGKAASDGIVGVSGGNSATGALTNGTVLRTASLGGLGGNGVRLHWQEGADAVIWSAVANHRSIMAVPLGAVPDSGARVTRFSVGRRAGRGLRWPQVER